MSDLSRKEPSTAALLERARNQPDSIREALENPAEHPAGVQYDKSDLPSEPVWDKGSTTKVAVDAPPATKMMDKTRDPAGIR
ncbi:uncharacterized protein ACLA_030820 [Aspergillus clavatus NRRL 1]|uniref:Uncharacterized protein n=1 Tax=Aspergillus clavatus (strain ATCC 1007 / CBS 513.65 / DSM 816 / NCTC 3887 / NRRL 1 / QM 1276 / 107) TaxID=344612 RepID=A1CRS8_ASPCL|nr:uncharacterized protein ACLA_030820 [Aspergillus clavatus NRRL 1]EAW08349.1 hypothetical protein ACLA_030820 [Aspergillus clavatus NRRL 1]